MGQGIGRALRITLAPIVCIALLASATARAECLSLSSGPVVFDVGGCTAIQPEKVFDTTKEKYEWIAGLDAAGKKKFYDSYRGLFVKGKVVKSEATQKGVTAEQGALMGETVYMYIPPSAPMQCNAVLGKRLVGDLLEVCCDGGGDIPCLLDTGYLLLQPKPIGAVDSSAGDSARQKAKKSAPYQAAEKAFAQKKYKNAVKSFEQAANNGELDIRGHYLLGYAYRELDQCGDAVRPLKYVYDQQTKKQIWADEEKTARRAVFLLARCYAKLNDPGPAVLIMNSYLLEPQKYKTELRESLKHKDFGWIHTSKEYREYEKQARAKLKTAK